MFFKDIIATMLLLCVIGCSKTQTDTDNHKHTAPDPDNAAAQTNTIRPATPTVAPENLTPSTSFLETVGTGRENPLLDEPPMRLKEKTDPPTRNMHVGAGLITDKDAEKWHKSVEGAEINVDVKLQ